MNNEELKVHDLVDIQDYRGEVYLKPEADKEIAELKQTLQDKLLEAMKYKAENIELLAWKKLHENCDNYIDMLEKKLESVQASMYADVVDANMENRRLKRALWLARALRARDIQRWWIAATCAPKTERACSVWNNVEHKCLKKAEEYK